LPSECTSAARPCSGAPPSVARSARTASLTGHGGRSAPPTTSPNARTAENGSRRGASAVASIRSKSIWRADQVRAQLAAAAP
jgi:hypothetical protein